MMTMKKWLTALVSLTLALLMAASALAADATVYKRTEEDEGACYVTDVQTVGDTLYILMRRNEPTSMELYRWKLGMAAPELVAGELCYARRFDTLEMAMAAKAEADEEDPIIGDPAYAIDNVMWSDGERLLFLNPLTGRIFTITGEGGKPVFEDVCVMDMTALTHVSGEGEDAYRYYTGIEQSAAVGNMLYISAYDWDENTGESVYKSLLVNLSTGEVKQAKAGYAQAVTTYRDGKLLLVSRDPQNEWDEEKKTFYPFTLLAYDPVADETETVGTWQHEYINGRVCYDSVHDALIYLDETRLMGLTHLTTTEQYGYLPDSYARCMTMLGDSLVFAGDTQVLLRTLTPGFSTEDSVTMYGGWFGSAEQDFAEAYPQVPVYMYSEYFDSAEALTQALVTGDSTIDLLRLTTTYSDFYRLMEKGYCADLSGDAEIMAYINRLHPVYRDAVTKDGKVYAVPMSAYSYGGWTVNRHVMEDMGLTIEDIPTNFLELCAFATRWNDEWVEEYPSYTLISYVEDYKRELFYQVMQNYIDYYQAKGLELRFNTPEFRALMEAIEAMRVDDLNEGANLPNEDETNYRVGLLNSYASLVGSFSDPALNTDSILIPMTLTKDTDYVIGAEVEIMFVNPRSKHMQSTLNLMKYKINEDNQDVFTLSTLLADKTEAVPYEHYDEMVEREQKYLAQLEKSLEKADDADKRSIQEAIDWQKEWMEKSMPQQQYRISEGAIRYYLDEVVPYVYVKRPTLMNKDNSGDLSTLMERYSQGQIKLDQFIKDMDGKVMMMQMEDY